MGTVSNKVRRQDMMRAFAILLAVVVALVLGYATKAHAAPGDLDPSFDTDGKTNTDFASPSDSGQSVAVQEDGKIIVAGRAYTGSATGTDFALARYNQDGTLDEAFGSGGKVTTPVDPDNSFYDVALAVAVRADGKIVVAGYRDTGDVYDDNNVTDFALARYNPDGTLDETFSGDGIVTYHFGRHDQAHGLAVQGNKVLVAGHAYVGGTSTGFDFALVRYNDNGNLDGTFGSGGVVKTDFSSGSDDHGRSVAVQEDGSIVVAGDSADSSSFPPVGDFALARYTASGILDTSFHTDGKVTTHFGSDDNRAFGVAVQEDSKILAAGYAANGSNRDFAVARYRTGGSLDGEFSTNGTTMIDFGSGDIAYGLAVQDDGRMVLAGDSNEDFALAHLNPDGSPNASFHYDGKLKTDFFGSSDRANGVAVQDDGKILAAGYAANGFNSDFALARYFGGNDDTPPKVKPPVQSLITGSTLKSAGTPNNVPVRFSWSATDVHGEVTDYDLQRSMDGGSYQNINLPSATTTTVTHLLSPTHNYRYRVRATDDNGNRSFWKYGPRFTVAAHQESSSAISYSGTWTQQSLSWAYGGALKYATAAGATAKLTFTGRNVAWVSARASNRGKAEVYLDGKKVATVDLYSATGQARKVIYAANNLNPSVTHTLQVKVLGTKRAASSGVRVDVDAFVVLR